MSEKLYAEDQKGALIELPNDGLEWFEGGVPLSIRACDLQDAPPNIKKLLTDIGFEETDSVVVHFA